MSERSIKISHMGMGNLSVYDKVRRKGVQNGGVRKICMGNKNDGSVGIKSIFRYLYIPQR